MCKLNKQNYGISMPQLKIVFAAELVVNTEA